MDSMATLTRPPRGDGLTRESSMFYNLTQTQSLYSRDSSPMKGLATGGRKPPRLGRAGSMGDFLLDEDQMMKGEMEGGENTHKVMSADAAGRPTKKKGKGRHRGNQFYTGEDRVRHENTLLPPIEARQGTFLRERSVMNGVTTWGTPGSVKQIQKQHWNLAPRRIRNDVSKKIVHHLRKQFLHRIDRRFNDYFDEDEMYDEVEQIKAELTHPHPNHSNHPNHANHHHAHHNHPPLHHHPHSLHEHDAERGLWRYDRVISEENNVSGQLVSPTRRTPIQVSSRPASKGEVRFSTSTPTARAVAEKLQVAVARPGRDTENYFPGAERYSYATDEEQDKSDKGHIRLDSRQSRRGRDRVLLPDIGDVQEESGKTPGDKDELKENEENIEGTGNFLTKGGIAYGSHSAKSKRVFDLTGMKTREPTEIRRDVDSGDEDLSLYINKISDEKVDATFNHVVVSPVPTPSIFSRPQTTRTGRKMTKAEKLMKVIQGQVHVRVSETSRVLKMFIHSCGIDTEVERSYLVENVYPKLRQFYKLKGYDLEVIDLLWGTSDLPLDDHGESFLVEAALKQCRRNNKGVSFISFMSQKYGEANLPVSIPRDEMEAILNVLATDYNGILQKVETKIMNKPEISKPTESITSETSKKSQWEKVRKNSERSGKTLSVAKSTPKSVTPISVKSPPPDEVDEIDGEADAQAELEAAQREKLRRVKEGDFSLRMLAIECGVVDSEEVFPEGKLVQTWYVLDENSVPAEYQLAPISSQWPDITAKDKHHRHEATESWKHAKHRLLSTLSHYAKKAGLTGFATEKYTSSELAKVLQDALSSSPVEPPLSCLWVTREILEIMRSLDDGKVKDYLDLSDVRRGQLNVQAQRKLSELTAIASKKIPQQRRMRYTIQWNRHGIDPEAVRTHATYMLHMCKDICDKILATHGSNATHGINDGDDITEQVRVKKELAKEVLAQTTFSQKKAYSFYGRKDILKRIKQYVRSNCNKPLVVHGKPGSGITSLLAKAAIDTHNWLAGSTVAVIQRMIAATSSSTNVRLLLKCLALQLCELYKTDSASVPMDYKSLSNQFYERLSSATDNKQLIIFIDSLHLLSDEHDAKKLTWIPKELPPNVKLIVSTDPSEKYGCLTQLQRMLPKSEDFFVEVSDVSQKDATVILDEWYSRTNRELRMEQKIHLLDCFKKCPLPLYLRVLYLESLKWKSFTDVKSIKMHPTIKGMVAIMLANLERKHGEPIVRRAIGYLTASRNGLSSTEMEDVLSLDEVVMADVSLHTKLQRRRIPPLYWARLRHDLENYIEESNCDDTVTIRWSHSPFKEAATERYLNNKDKAPSYHKALAEYFMNVWHEKVKPYPGNESGSQRYVMEQPLYTEIPLTEDSHVEASNGSDDSSQEEEEHDVPTARQFNLRRLSELPFHLLKSAQSEQLKTNCLCNFEFILAKITAFSLRVFFEDLEMALSVEPNDKDLNLLSDTLFLSSKVLTNDTKQLSSQIVGRLYEIITKDLPVAPQDPVNYPYLKPFLKSARQPSTPAIVPSMTCLTSPGGTMYDLLSGHTDPITAVHITEDGQYVITASHDNTLKTWEMRTGRVTQTIAGVGKAVKQIRIGLEDKMIITSEENCVRVWERKSGHCAKKLKLDDPSSLCMAMNGAYVVAFTHGTNMMISLDLANMEILAHVDVKETMESQIHQDRSVIAAMQGVGPAALYAFRSYCEAVVRHAKSGEVIQRLKCRDGASIQGLACTNQYYVCAARYRYMKVQEVYYMEVFDTTTGKLVRSVRGCTDDDITDIFVNNTGSHAIALCTSQAANTSNIAVWNIETQDHKHLAAHTQVACAGACVDLKQCLTTCENENSIRMWNLLGLVNKPAPKQKSKAGILELVKIPSQNDRILAKSTAYGNMSMWDVSTGQCIDKSIKIGAIQDKTDIVKISETTAVILTDKTINSEGGNPIYQTILSFDLIEKEFTNQVKDCFIFDCPEHEYVLLDKDHIMGLSETRTHFVVWNVHNGQLAYRIKPNFRGKPKEQNSPVIQRKKRNHTAKMLPWDRRLETQSARQKRHNADIEEHKEQLENLRKEKENGINQYVISDDRSIIVASFFAHHMCVLDVQKQEHIQTLENYDSMMLLYVSAMTHDGSHLVHANYDEESKTSYLTLWHCRSGDIIRRIRNEQGICAVAINNSATKIVFGKSNQELRIWEPHIKRNPVRRIYGYSQLNFGVDSQIHITENDSRAVVFAGDISLWDLNKEILLSVFTPEAKIQCFDVVLNGKVIVFGMKDSAELISLKLRSKSIFDPDISEDEEEEKSESETEED